MARKSSQWRAMTRRKSEVGGKSLSFSMGSGTAAVQWAVGRWGSAMGGVRGRAMGGVRCEGQGWRRAAQRQGRVVQGREQQVFRE